MPAAAATVSIILLENWFVAAFSALLMLRCFRGISRCFIICHYAMAAALSLLFALLMPLTVS